MNSNQALRRPLGAPVCETPLDVPAAMHPPQEQRRKQRFSWVVLCLVPLLLAPIPIQAQGQVSGKNPSASASVPVTPTAADRETDKQNMLSIYRALKAYEKEHGKLPDWLS